MEVTGAQTYTTTYTYNAANRLVTETKTGNGVEAVLAYTYDANGNLRRRYTAASGYSNITYEYDGFGQLTQLQIAGVAASYTYNADGIRTAKVVGEDVTTYLTDGGNVVAERVNGELTTYLRGANLISRKTAVSTEYYLYNAHGDVVVLTPTSVNGGYKTYTYDAFGNETAPYADDTNPFRYCGEYYDRETGTYYLRARYYAPTIGRFTQQDTHWTNANRIYGDNPQKTNEREDRLGIQTYTYVPQIAAVLQSGNLYVYCMNDPVMYVDPNGNEWYHWAIGGALVAVAAAAVVVTAGGVLPALWAVGAVASGATAATTASTITAGAFIGSSLAFGAEILRADFTSITTINDSADWGTVGEIFTGGLLGSAYGFILSKTNELLNVKKIARKIVNADRVSSAVSKNDIYHRACSFLSETQLSKGTAFYITGHDKVRCILLQVQGEINGVKGIFEFILQPDGTVSHQLFTKIG